MPREHSGKKPRNSPFLCIEDLLAHYGRTAPDRAAILAPRHAPLNYEALWARTKDVIDVLRGCGVGRHDRVGVVLPDGPETAVAVVAVAAGAICVPLHPGFTAAEWQRYFRDLRIAALLTRRDMASASRAVARKIGIPVIDLLPQPSDGPCAFNLVGWEERRKVDALASPSDDAFILLTSGTTSRPKTVPLTHASVCQSAYNVGVALALKPEDRLLNVLPLFHGHGLISGLLAALAAGSSVVSTPGFDAAAFFAWLREFRPTWYTAVPPIHRALLSEARHKRITPSRCLRLVRSASLSLPSDVLSDLETLFGVPVIETYGMTEAATQIAANPLARRKAGSVGQPAGAEIAITDAHGRHLSAGERGEIVLRGPTIMRGYDNDAAATQAAFRDGWFRTGDVGYFDEDGYLFIVGRLKKADVINRGGQKVAAAEVEEALLDHPDVVEAAAFPIPHPRLGEDVAAAIVTRRGAKIGEHTLRKFVSERLATFKVPGVIRHVAEIPRAPDGKIERSELATMRSIGLAKTRADRTGKMRLPQSELEWQLVNTWGELLGLREVGVDQDIFALGADSLTVTRMLSRLKTGFGVDVSFKDVFDAPTCAGLAARIESSGWHRAVTPISLRDTVADARSFRLSFQQQRVYLLSKLDQTGYTYHVLDVVRVAGSLNFDALDASIATICQRHDALRSTFQQGSGELLQTAGTAWEPLQRVDLVGCPKNRRAATIRHHATQSLREGFEIERMPPLKVQVFRFDEHDHAIVIKAHHLITDGWSRRLFWQELEAIYAARLNGAAVRLPELPIQYRNFVEWQHAWLLTPPAQAQRTYWQRQLQGLTELPLRTDRPRSNEWTGCGARQPLQFSRELTRRIKSMSRAHGVTLFMTLLSAFKCLLHRYTGHDDIAVGSLIANRNQVDIEHLMGMFANTIVLRTDLSGDPKFTEVMQAVRQVTLDAYRNQDLPIEEIQQGLTLSGGMHRSNLFEVMFLLQGIQPVPELPGLSVDFVDMDPGTARCSLTLELFDGDRELTGWLEYSTDLFAPATIARMAEHLQTLLQSIVGDPEERISRLTLLPLHERQKVLSAGHGTRTRIGRHGTFLGRFVRQVERTPDAPAVSCGESLLSYRDLARRSFAIANHLADAGVGADVLVGLLAERSTDFLAAMIGVQQAGGAFLPLDATFPSGRLAQILQHCRIRLIVTGETCAARLQDALSGMGPQERPQVLSLEELVHATVGKSTRPVRLGSSSFACAIYTSGSTGLPKGAMIEQRGLLNHLLSKISDLKLSASDVIAQTAPQTFVISLWQFLAPVMVGARVHICADEVTRDPALLVQAIARHGVTILQVVPAHLRAILERTPTDPAFRVLSRLRWLISTGELLSPDLCREWFRHFPDVPIMNAYGLSECSDDVATHPVAAPPPPSISTMPIGRPIANTHLYVLDAQLQPVPIGVAGDLFVGGAAVGRGYLHDLEQTQRTFVRDPFVKARGARMYRSGDLARWRSDGVLECLGRVDRQVKLRGYRIELEEIEHVLMDHPDVKTAVVLVRDDARDEPRLVAHIVAPADRRPKPDDLAEFMRTKLPRYMVPSSFIFLEELPVTAHGKISRSALLAISSEIRVGGKTFVAPRSSTEKLLADIWIDFLGIRNVGISDNFFDLGGHSLLAAQLLARVANVFGVSLPMRALFEAPTVEGLSHRIDLARQTQPQRPELAGSHVEDDPYPVSVAQEEMLRIEQELPGLPQFNLSFAYRLRGPLDLSALERSLAQIVRRHAVLRQGFRWVADQPVILSQEPADLHSPLVIEDLSAGVSIKSRRTKELLLKKAELIADQEAWTPIDVDRPPLFRVRVLRLGANDHVFLFVVHHIIIDGWSIGVFTEELAELYGTLAKGGRPRLAEPESQYSDFVRWQRSWCTTSSANRQFAYWREHLRDAGPLFPTDANHGRAPLATRNARELIALPNELVTHLTRLGRTQGATLFMTLLTAFKTLMLGWTGRTDICIATAMANRSLLRMERVIGPFENTTLIRTRMDPDLSFHEALARVRTSVLEAHARQEYPFDILAARLAEEEQDASSLIQVVFVLQNAFRRPFQLPDITVQPYGDPSRLGQPALAIDPAWLVVFLREGPDGIKGSCSYRSDLLEANNVRHWIAQYATILAKVAANSEMSLSQLTGVCR
jgi:amino acid adenylation domain-containing protein